MVSTHSRIVLTLAAAGIVLAVHTAVARVDVQVEFDKAFDFKAAHTWAWNPQGPGEVKMARTRDDDPDAMRAKAEPVIVEAVAAELSRRGLRPASAAPDVFVTYYLLLTVGMSAQEIGQFIPATPMWGLPPFSPATQSLQVMHQGSLVLDVSAEDRVVWRGVARAKIDVASNDTKREALIRDAVRDLLRRYPRPR